MPFLFFLNNQSKTKNFSHTGEANLIFLVGDESTSQIPEAHASQATQTPETQDSPPEGYFASANQAYEEALNSGNFNSDETLNEISESYSEETSFFGKVLDFIQHPIEGMKWLKTKVAVAMMGEQLEEYSRARGLLQNAQDSVSDILNEAPEAFDNPAEAAQGAIAQLDAVPSLSGHLPSGSLTLMRHIPGLRTLLAFGGIGAVAFGVFTLQEDMNAHPENYTDIPSDPHERITWWQEKLTNLNVSENTDEIVATLTGDATLAQMFPDEANEIQTDNQNSAEETNSESDESRERVGNYIPLSEAISRTENQFNHMLSNVNSFIIENRELMVAGGVLLGGSLVFSESARGFATGVATGTMDTLKKLASIPFSLNGTTLQALAIGMGGLYLYRDRLIAQAQETGEDISNIMVPADFDTFKSNILETIQSSAEDGEEWIKTQAEELESEELDSALDYVAGAKDDLMNINPQEFMAAATASIGETLGETDTERLNNIARRSIESMRNRLASNSEFEDVVLYLDEITQSLESDNQTINLSQIERLSEIASQHKILITLNSNESLFQWAHFDNNTPSNPDMGGPHNLCVNPSLPTNQQNNIAMRYRTHESGLQSWIEIGNIPVRNTREIAQRFSNALQGGAFISVQGNDVVMHTASEAYLVGPFNVYKTALQELGDILPGGDEFELDEVAVEFGAMTVPALLIGSPFIIRDALRSGGSAWRTGLRAVTRPLTLPIDMIRYATDGEFRHLEGLRVSEGFHGFSEALYDNPIGRRFFEARSANIVTEGHRLALERTSLEYNTFLNSSSLETRRTQLYDLISRAEISPDILQRQGDSYVFSNGTTFRPESADHRDLLARITRDERNVVAESTRVEELLSISNRTPSQELQLQEAQAELNRKRQMTPERIEADLENIRNDSYSRRRSARDERRRQRGEETSRTHTESHSEGTSHSPHGTHEPEIHATHGSHGPEIHAPHGTHSTLHSTARGAGGAALTLAAVLGGQRIVNHFRNRNINEIDLSEIQESNGDNELETASQEQEVAGYNNSNQENENSEIIHNDETDENAESQTNPEDPEAETSPLNLLQDLNRDLTTEYNEQLDELLDLDTIETMSESEKTQRIRNLIDLHRNKINQVTLFCQEHQEDIKEFFRQNAAIEGRTEVDLSPYFRLQYKHRQNTIELQYVNDRRFGQNLQDTFQFKKHHINAEREGRNPGTLSTIASSAGYMVPVVGSGLDARDSFNSFRRGDLRGGIASAGFATVGLVVDVAGLFSFGTTTAIGRTALTGARVIRNADRINDAIHASRGLSIASHAMGPMMGLDLARGFSPEFNRRITIGSLD